MNAARSAMGLTVSGAYFRRLASRSSSVRVSAPGHKAQASAATLATHAAAARTYGNPLKLRRRGNNVRLHPPARPAVSAANQTGKSHVTAPRRERRRTHFFSQRRTRPENSLNRSEAAILRTPDMVRRRRRRAGHALSAPTAGSAVEEGRPRSSYTRTYLFRAVLAGYTPRERTDFWARVAGLGASPRRRLAVDAP